MNLRRVLGSCWLVMLPSLLLLSHFEQRFNLEPLSLSLMDLCPQAQMPSVRVALCTHCHDGSPASRMQHHAVSRTASNFDHLSYMITHYWWSISAVTALGQRNLCYNCKTLLLFPGVTGSERISWVILGSIGSVVVSTESGVDWPVVRWLYRECALHMFTQNNEILFC